MRIARISLDILGLIPRDDFVITTRYTRSRKIIELIESVMSITAWAWRLLTQDTNALQVWKVKVQLIILISDQYGKR